MIASAIEAFSQVLFTEAHWLLAIHYWKTATYTPKILRKEPVVPSHMFKAVWWIGVAVSALTPVINEYFEAKLDWFDFYGRDTKALVIWSSVAAAVSQLWLVLIGVLSILSVILINRFMQTLPLHKRIDVKALLIHAGAFGLYLVSVLIFLVFLVLGNIFPDAQIVFELGNIAYLLQWGLAFISEGCICYVFW
jgi:hypothetical protein